MSVSDILLEAKGLSAWYGAAQILYDVDLQVRRGEVVALMGRNHPLGIVLSSLLFGALFQGGAELSFEIPGFSRDMVTTLQGLIVLFSGAMAQLAAPALARVCGWFKPSGAIAAAPGPGAAGG